MTVGGGHCNRMPKLWGKRGGLLVPDAKIMGGSNDHGVWIIKHGMINAYIYYFHNILLKTKLLVLFAMFKFWFCDDNKNKTNTVWSKLNCFKWEHILFVNLCGTKNGFIRNKKVYCFDTNFYKRFLISNNGSGQPLHVEKCRICLAQTVLKILMKKASYDFYQFFLLLQ